MDNLHEQNEANIEEMATSERNSESARLVASNTSGKPSYLNLISNICAVIIVGIITYCSFSKGVSLFSFHPTLMSLGVSIHFGSYT